jgi:hypothetical protein
VVAGLAWAADSAVGLWWLARFEPAGPDDAVLLWPGVLLSAARVAAAGLAVVLVFVVAEAAPQTPSRVGGRPSASTATASPRNPTARPSWGE